MNNLQAIESDTDFCVTLNRTERIDPAKIVKAVSYSHPVFTPEGVTAQRRRDEISGVDRTHYCGAYWGWGFHEDGVVSGLAAAADVGAAGRGPRAEPREELAA
jgi:predicted NAD/FAD-binding protein